MILHFHPVAKTEDMPPLHWRVPSEYEREKLYRGPDKRPVPVIVTCRHGHQCAIRVGVHSVSPSGTLSPSLVCPVEGCGGHEPPGCVLEGWRS